MLANSVLVTRPLSQNKGLVEGLQQSGFNPVIFPLLSIKGFHPHSQPAHLKLQSQVTRLAEYDVLIFISTNAANIACEWFDAYWPQLPQQRWFAIGKATANCLKQQALLGLPDIVENTIGMNSEALLNNSALQAANIAGQRVLIVRGIGGRETLRQTLEQRGARVDYLEVYRREDVEHPIGTLAEYLQLGLQVLTVTSSQSLDKLLEEAIINNKFAEIVALPLVVPSLRLQDMAKRKGFLNPICAENAGVDAMLTAIMSIKNEF